ncbi:hypothetical protein K490DRAFT_65661 [Saccharata proteae CBS 121410]|uniref:Uncharacterized protein n=1 Tax=Saccharata proteae CBS 121410 TaxID=1314787 RepID=A0A9P4HWE8_9PEZI|nr:hypothetical protein K490DRAFT_65661 [Saccharata proteae CBS 121410]
MQRPISSALLIPGLPEEVSIQIIGNIVRSVQVVLRRITPLDARPHFAMVIANTGRTHRWDELLPLLRLNKTWTTEVLRQICLNGRLLFDSSAAVEPVVIGGRSVLSYGTHEPPEIVQLLHGIADNIRNFSHVEIHLFFPGSSARAMDRVLARMPRFKSIRFTYAAINDTCTLVHQRSPVKLLRAQIIEKGLATFILNLCKCRALRPERVFFAYPDVAMGPWYIEGHEFSALLGLLRGEMALAKQKRRNRLRWGRLSRERTGRNDDMLRLELELREFVLDEPESDESDCK